MNPKMATTMKSLTSKNSNKSSSKSRSRRIMTNSSPKHKERFRKTLNTTKFTINTEYQGQMTIEDDAGESISNDETTLSHEKE